MFDLFRKPSEEIVAVFDIGNGSIGGALVKFNAHGLPVVLYSHREPLTLIPHPTSRRLLNSMLKLLKSVAKHVAQDGLAHIKTSPFGSHKLRDAYCVFASPWYISQTKIIRQEWDKPVSISKGLIDDFVKKEQLEFSALKDERYQRIFGTDARLLEKKVINVRLNGYVVQEPIGKRARQLELTLFSSFISHDCVSKVEDVLHNAFAVRHIHHYSYGLVSWGASQILFNDIHDYFFVDISGETTDISLIVRDILIETVSFPMGRNTILRKIVKDLKVEPDIAISYLSMYFNNNLSPDFKAKLESILTMIREDWFDSLIVALKKFQKIYSLPRSTFVTADVDVSKFFTEALSKECPPELNLAKGTLAVTYIGADKVQRHIQLLSNVTQDSFLATESIFLNNLFSHTA